MSSPPRPQGHGPFAPVDPASLAFFRIAFGLLMAGEVVRFFAMGWIAKYYIDPPFHFTYFGFEWVRPWPGIGMHVHFAVLGVAAIGIALGVFYRACAWIFAAGFTYVFLLEKARYLNHFYLIALMALLIAIVPAHRAFSLRRRKSGEPSAVPAWTIGLLRAQVGLVYFYAGIAKLNSDWLRGEPLRAWLGERTNHPVLGELLAHDWAAHFFSYGGLVLDLVSWPLLAYKPTRTAMFLFATAFHLMNASLFSIGVFPWFMIAATTIFFEPDWPRRMMRLATPALELASPSAARRRCVLGFVAIYLAIQLLVPLRHFLYPGSVHWTEEGHMFAWHMKLRDKEAYATFFLTDPATGITTRVDPRAELTSEQARKMAGRPDMILDYAHHLARTRTPASGRVEVRVHATASLNGRARQLIVDPTVDLARETRNMGRADWIVPLTTPLR